MTKETSRFFLPNYSRDGFLIVVIFIIAFLYISGHIIQVIFSIFLYLRDNCHQTAPAFGLRFLSHAVRWILG